jgi:hypothetical protein
VKKVSLDSRKVIVLNSEKSLLDVRDDYARGFKYIIGDGKKTRF